MNVTPRVATGAPPLLFVLFWNAFTAVHAFFMLRGAWGSSALYFLLPFYALFFGVGLWMARQWWRGRSLRQRFGAPMLAALPAVLPGQSLQLAVEFDRDWARSLSLEAQLRWVEVLAKGGSGKTLVEAPVQGGAGPGPRGTLWQGMGLVPPRPSSPLPLRLELTLQPQGETPGSGWRLPLPLHDPARAGGETLQLTPAQSRQLDRVLGWVMIALVGAGSWQLFAALTAGPRVLFPLVFPGVLLLGASVVYELRQVLSRTLAAGPSSREEMAERLKPFAATVRRRAQGFFVLSVLALLADMLGVLDKI